MIVDSVKQVTVSQRILLMILMIMMRSVRWRGVVQSGVRLRVFS